MYGEDCSDLDRMSSFPGEEDSDSEEIRKSNDTCNLCYKMKLSKT